MKKKTLTCCQNGFNVFDACTLKSGIKRIKRNMKTIYPFIFNNLEVKKVDI